MAPKRDPRRDEAFELWKQHKGKITNREIADRLEVPEKTISAWKSRDKWNAVLQKNDCSTTNKKVSKKARSPNKKNKEEPVVESDELTDKQRLFCMYYIKYFNVTKAYQKAYECDYHSARANGARLIANDSIISEIKSMKEEHSKGIMIDAQFVLQKYIDIAFADITDFVDFGQKEIAEVNPITGEPLLDDDGEQVTYPLSYVSFKDAGEVDGTIITEVKKGKDGVSVKLADKMKALDFLAKYTDILSDNDRKKLQDEKLKTDILKTKADTEFAKMRASKLRGDKKDTSMMEALIEGRKRYEEMKKESEKDG